MDIGSTTATSLYNYQTTLKSSGQSSAVIQALGQAYTAVEAATGPSSSDPLAGLAGASAVGSLLSGLTTLSQAQSSSDGGSDSGSTGSTTSALSGLQANTYGGLDSNSATALLASLNTSSSSSGLQGFSAAVDSKGTLAVAAYQAQQAYPVSTPSASASPSSTPTTTLADTGSQSSAVPASSGTAATPQEQATAVQQAIQTALSPVQLSLLA